MRRPSCFTVGLLLCSLFRPLPRARSAEFISHYNSDTGGGTGPFPDSDTGAYHSSLASDNDKNVEIYSNIIDLLGQLDVLTSHGRSCYVLHKIEKIVNSSTTGGSETKLGDGNNTIVEVRLFFTESVLTNLAVAKTDDTSSDGNANSGGAGSVASDDIHKGEDEELANRTRAECKKKQAFAIWETAALTSGENDYAVNGSGSISAPSAKIEDDSGLSHTQLVVIVTCSCIVGLFFLVAGIIRIRNCVHRLREEQAIAKRPTFRSCTVALRDSTGSSELLRRETLSSRSPSKGEDDRNSRADDSIQSSPKQTGNTNNPNFLATSSSPKQDVKNTSLQSPTSSIKYIDEDDTSKKGSDTDEVEDEGESESKPLLASEILSGKEDNREKGKSVHFGNSLAFEEFPNNNDSLTNTTDTNGANLNPNFSSIENDEIQPPIGSVEPEISWLEQAVEESTIGSVTAGLTQSDSSLSSSNKFYNYGNGQLEYVAPYETNNGDATSVSSGSIGSPCSDKNSAQPSLEVEAVKGHEESPKSNICDNQANKSHPKQSVLEDNSNIPKVSSIENIKPNSTSNQTDNNLNTDYSLNNNPNNLPTNDVPHSFDINPMDTTTSSATENQTTGQLKGTTSGQGDAEHGVVLVDVEGNYTHPSSKDLHSKEDSLPLANANLEGRLPSQKNAVEDFNQRDKNTTTANNTSQPISTSTTTPSSSTSPHHVATSNTSSPKAIPNVMSTLPPIASRESEYL